MAKNHTGASRHKNSFRGVLLTSVFLGTSVLGACSSVPDAVNPVEWYKGTVDLFAGDKKAAKEGGNGGLAADRGKAPPGSEKPFPNLASVDQQARARDQKGGGLSADSERPKYAPSIRRQEASSEAPAAPKIASAPKSVVGATMPPPAVPTKTVTAVPVTRPAPVPAPVMTAQKSPQVPKTIPKLAPPNLTVDQQATEERLARQLAEIRAQAKIAPDTTLRVRKQAPSGGQDTIVISSDGIETLGAMANQEAAQMTTLAQTSPVTQSPPASQTGSRLVETAAQPLTGAVLKIATIIFDNGSSRLKAGDKRILSAVKRLQGKRGGTLRIVGHASTRTRNMSTVKHMMTNFKISVARADRVVSELVRLGFKKENIEVAAVSDREPLYYETMPSGETGNRRTEIFLIN